MTAVQPFLPAKGDRFQRRRLAAWMGIWALLLYALIPLGQAISLGNGLDRLVICTALGAKIPSNSGAADSPSKAPSSCVVCQLHDLGKTLAFADSCPLVSPVAHGAAQLAAPGSAEAGRPARSWFARAPPAFA